MNDNNENHDLLVELEKQRTKTVVAGTLIPQLSGLICVIGGVVLLLLGITGTTSILVESGDFKANLLNASPGVVLLLIGFLIIFVSIPKQRSYTEINKDGISTGIYIEHGMVMSDKNEPQNKKSNTFHDNIK
ncbi:MAG: hypothetical protein JAZ15_18900 [Candidatus Thiodiazotropha endolucinida]|nr:hypothetical protein [Candidatus Thiodiazotropha taylori]MCW4315090.1 hypothetical protein [Candidatus Thiodiazotropha taylori]